LREGREHGEEVESGSRARHTLNSLRDSAHARTRERHAVTVAIWHMHIHIPNYTVADETAGSESGGGVRSRGVRDHQNENDVPAFQVDGRHGGASAGARRT
jgi:hypothetical protein